MTGPRVRHRHLRWIAMLAIVASSWIAFAPAVDYPFVNWDDPDYVVDNPHIRSLAPGAVAGLFAPTTIVVANYAPVTLLSYAIDHATGGTHPRPYHRTNILLHLLNGALVFLLLERLGLATPLAWFGATLFVLHPLQVESVAWVSGRKNVLSLALALGAMLIELRGRGGVVRRAAGLGLFAAALLSKATVVVVPLLLVSIWVVLDRRPPRAAVRAAIPYFTLSLVAGIATIAAQRSIGAIKSYYGDSALLTLATMARVFWLELRLFFQPDRLAAVYRPPVASSLLEPSVLLAIAALAGAILLAHAHRRRAPRAFVFAAWYGIGLLPVLNLVPLPHLMADRFLYISSIGAFGLAAWLVGKVAAQLPAKRIGAFSAEDGFIVALGILVGGACIAGTRARLPVWSDSEALWRDTLDKTPTAEIAHSNLGLILALRGDDAGAIGHYRRALELRPDFADARVNLANALVRLGRIEDAFEVYGEGLELDPRDVEARYNLAVAMTLSGEEETARVLLESILEYDPEHGRALDQLGVAALRAGRDAEALDRLDAAVAVEPLLAPAHFHRAIALGRLGREHEAVAALERVIELEPDHARAHLQLGLTLVGSRQAQGVERGRQAIQRALKLDPALAARIPEPLRDDVGPMDRNGH